MAKKTIEEEHDESLDVAKKMIIHGGSFVNALGKALQCADIYNVRKIKKTWPKYWAQYLKQAKLEAKA